MSILYLFIRKTFSGTTNYSASRGYTTNGIGVCALTIDTQFEAIEHDFFNNTRLHVFSIQGSIRNICNSLRHSHCVFAQCYWDMFRCSTNHLGMMCFMPRKQNLGGENMDVGPRTVPRQGRRSRHCPMQPMPRST